MLFLKKLAVGTFFLSIMLTIVGSMTYAIVKWPFQFFISLIICGFIGVAHAIGDDIL